MRVLSWNLWWRYGPWERRREAIAATLAEVEPDLCGLQEVWGAAGGNLAADLAGRLGMHCYWAPASRERDGLTLGNAILSRWPITAQAQAGLPRAGRRRRAGWRCTPASTRRAARCPCSPPT
jgi:endonuclease/exonuclease/phosphatase family metal-dependent hydrolase